jgi:hypothetical protein
LTRHKEYATDETESEKRLRGKIIQLRREVDVVSLISAVLNDASEPRQTVVPEQL